MSIDFRSANVFVAVAIIIGSALVAAALYNNNAQALSEGSLTIQRAAAAERHIYGSPQAPITIVEFSDYQCPFCARLHPDLQRIVDESNGQIAWEYRHLPLRNHPLATPAAVAAECVAIHQGNDAFWKYSHDLFPNQPRLTPAYIEESALALGLTEKQLRGCEADQDILKRIQNDTEAAVALGGSGTPYSVILFPDNSYRPVSGAVPYEQLKSLISAYE